MNVTHNTGTTKRLMKTAAKSLHLFNTSYVAPPLEDQSITQAPEPTPYIYILEIPSLQVWMWSSMLMVIT